MNAKKVWVLVFVALIAIVLAVLGKLMGIGGKNDFLIAGDGVKIAYDWYSTAEDAKGYVALAHMMPATKESWRDFAVFLQERGYSSIAIDLRGHGKSEEGPNGFLKFSDEEHQKSILDLSAATDFLKQQGALEGDIKIIGASIGANLALQYLADNFQIKSAVLLSPGLNYRGIETEPLIQKLQAGQKVLLVASEDDVRSGGNAVSMSKRLYDLAPSGVDKKLEIFKTGGHGTGLFESAEKNLAEIILGFLEK